MRPRFAVGSTGVCRIDVERRVADPICTSALGTSCPSLEDGTGFSSRVAAGSGRRLGGGSEYGEAGARRGVHDSVSWVQAAARSADTRTSSPTITPPVSSACCQRRPNSPRLIVPRTSMPTRSRLLRIGGDAVHGDFEPDRVRLAVHRQVAGDAIVALVDVLDRGRLEPDRRVVLGVEEVGRAEMVVAADSLVSIEAVFDRSPHLRVVVVGRRFDRPLVLAEVAAHGRDHHVLDRTRPTSETGSTVQVPVGTRTIPRVVLSSVDIRAPLGLDMIGLDEQAEPV